MSQLQSELESDESPGPVVASEPSMAARFAKLHEINDYLAGEIENPQPLSEELKSSSHRVWQAFKQALA